MGGGRIVRKPQGSKWQVLYQMILADTDELPKEFYHGRSAPHWHSLVATGTSEKEVLLNQLWLSSSGFRF